MIEHKPEPWMSNEGIREERGKAVQVLDLSLYDHVFHSVDFGEDPYEDPNIPADRIEDAQQARAIRRTWEGANAISSALLDPKRPGVGTVATDDRQPNGKHTIALDIDHRVRVVPSTTEGHSHLYIDVELEWEQYEKLLDVLGEIGVVQPGYVAASKRRKATHLRLPWVKKEPEKPDQADKEPEPF